MRKLIVIMAAAALLLSCGGSAWASLMHYWSADLADDDPGGLLQDTARNFPWVGKAGEPDYDATRIGGTSTERIAGPTGVANSAARIYGGYSGGTIGYKSQLLNLGGAGTAWTWEMMLRYDAGAYRHGYITDRAGGPINMNWTTSYFLYAFNVMVGSASMSPSYKLTPNYTHWYLLALVSDGTSIKQYVTEYGTATQYLLATWDFPAGTPAAVHATQGLSMGCCDGQRYGANGYVDWSATWDVALTAAQLSTHNLENTPIPPQSIVPEPAALGLVGVVLLGLKRRRS